MAVVGIDFGNLNCVIAQAGRGGVDVILNENSKRLNPCIVSIQGQQRFIGSQASSMIKSNYRNTITEVKRLVGKLYNDPDLQNDIEQFLHYNIIEKDNNFAGIEIDYGDDKLSILPYQAIAMILFKLIQIAEQANTAGVGVAEAVISIPGWWGDIERQTMLAACKTAGLNCLSLIHETTAAGIQYGIYKSAKKLLDDKVPQNVMIIDLGHSSYSVAIIAFLQGKMEVLSTAYDKNLGGRLFTQKIVDYIVEKWNEKYPSKDLYSKKKTRIKLYDAAEKAKKVLSPIGVNVAHIHIECLMDDIDFSVHLDRSVFESSVTSLIDRLDGPLQSCIKESGLELNQINSFELIGGGSRIPIIKERIADVLNLDKEKNNFGLSTTMNPDEAVSRGCALMGAILSSRFQVKDFQVKDNVPYSIEFSWDEEEEDKNSDDMNTDEKNDNNSIALFPRGIDFPRGKRLQLKRRRNFTINYGYQNEMVSLLPHSASSSTSLGKINIKGITSSEEKKWVRLNVWLTQYGLINVSNVELMEPIEEVEEDNESNKNNDESSKKNNDELTKDNNDESTKDNNDESTKENNDESSSPTKENNDKMDIDNDAPKKKKKKKYHAKQLEFEIISYNALSKEDIMKAEELEANMRHQDRLIQETSDMRNELESYIYSMRDRIIDDLRPYASEDDASKFKVALTEAEDWLYTDEGFDGTKATFQKKLGELRNYGNPIESRLNEHTHRSNLVQQFCNRVEQYKTWANQNNAEHITDEERDTVRDLAKNAENWVLSKVEEQGHLELHQDPIIKINDIITKQQELINKCNSIVNKPVPKKEEPKKEEPTKEEPKKEEGKDNNENSDNNTNNNEEETSTNNDEGKDNNNNNEEESNDMDIEK